MSRHKQAKRDEQTPWICLFDYTQLSPNETKKLNRKVARVERRLNHRTNKFTQHELAKLIGVEYVEQVLAKLKAKSYKIFTREVTESHGWRKRKTRRTTQYIIKRW